MTALPPDTLPTDLVTGTSGPGPVEIADALVAVALDGGIALYVEPGPRGHEVLLETPEGATHA